MGENLAGRVAVVTFANGSSYLLDGGWSAR
jgi:hypothetical protein